MGTVGSKSPLERRNTVARRSQRRTLHNLKPKTDNVYKDIKKFKGITEDANYVALKNEIEYLKNDLTRRGKDLQPQVRNLYENNYKRLCEAEEALQNKLVENKEKHEKKEAKKIEKDGETKEAVEEVMSNIGDEENDEGNREENEEKEALENNNEKRKTVELKFVQVIPEEDTRKLVKEVRIVSPEEKRKSILKVGVRVMPGAVMNEFAAQSNRITRQYDLDDTSSQMTAEDVISRIDNIVESLRQIECDISDFVGEKHGKQYNTIRDILNRYLIELNQMNPSDEYAVDQLKICRNYVGSCLSFLEERATDDVFFRRNEEDSEKKFLALKNVQEKFKSPRIMKNTEV